MHLKEGNLLFFPKLIYKNGQKSKDGKFFLVLKRGFDDLLLVSLPSSKEHIPIDLLDRKGCYYNSSCRLSFYTFKQKDKITTCGYYFKKDTRLYGENLETRNEEEMKSEYPNEGDDYELKGKLKPEILKSIQNCFKNSGDVVKNRYRRMI